MTITGTSADIVIAVDAPTASSWSESVVPVCCVSQCRHRQGLRGSGRGRCRRAEINACAPRGRARPRGGELQALEIAARNDAQDLATFEQRDMAEAAVPHQPQRVDRRLVGRKRDWIARHDLVQACARRIAAFGQHAAHRVTAGEDADQPAGIARDQYGAGLSVPHLRAGRHDARGLVEA
jgi:hypothetical protein